MGFIWGIIITFTTNTHRSCNSLRSVCKRGSGGCGQQINCVRKCHTFKSNYLLFHLGFACPFPDGGQLLKTVNRFLYYTILATYSPIWRRQTRKISWLARHHPEEKLLHKAIVAISTISACSARGAWHSLRPPDYIVASTFRHRFIVKYLLWFMDLSSLW